MEEDKKWRGYRMGTIGGVLHQFFDDGEIVRVEPDPVMQAKVKGCLENLKRRFEDDVLRQAAEILERRIATPLDGSRE